MLRKFLHIVFVILIFIVITTNVRAQEMAKFDLCANLDENSDQKIIKNCQAQCEEQGGQWGGVITGRGRSSGCHPLTKDYGKSCKESSQCEGGCTPTYDKVTQTEHNVCARYKSLKGKFIIRDKDGLHTIIVE